MHRHTLYVVGRGRLAMAVRRIAASAHLVTATSDPGSCDPDHTTCIYLARSGKPVRPEELPLARRAVTLTTGQLTRPVGVPEAVDAHVTEQLTTYRALQVVYGHTRVRFLRAGRLFATNQDGLEGAVEPLVHAWSAAMAAGAGLRVIKSALPACVYWHSVETAACALIGMALDQNAIPGSTSPFSGLHVPAVRWPYGRVIAALAEASPRLPQLDHHYVPGAVGDENGRLEMYSTDIVEWLYQQAGSPEARTCAPMTRTRLTAELYAHAGLRRQY